MPSLTDFPSEVLSSKDKDVAINWIKEQPVDLYTRRILLNLWAANGLHPLTSHDYNRLLTEPL